MAAQKGFVLYKDTKALTDMLDREQRGDLLQAIMEYETGGTVPELDAVTQVVFIAVKTYLDRDEAKYTEVCEKRRQSAIGHGRPKKANVSKKSNCFSEKQTEANADNIERVKETDTDSVIDKKVNRRKSATFTPPTIEEVNAYCRLERKNNVDAERFVDYYAARGWELSKGRKMKDWKAAVRTWERNNFGKDNGSNGNEYQSAAIKRQQEQYYEDF